MSAAASSSGSGRHQTGSEGDQAGPGRDQAGPERDQAGSARKTGAPPGRVRRTLLIATLSAIVLLGVLLAVLASTRGGRQIVLDGLLGQAEERLGAEVTASAMRSGNPFLGTTLSAVSVGEPGRPPAFSADSVRVSYSIWSLLRGEPTLAGLELWNPVLVVERRPGEDELNWTRILANPSGPAATSNPRAEARDPSPLVVRDISLFDGEVIVRLPAPPGEAGAVEAADGSGFVRERRFSRVRGRLREIGIGANEGFVDVFALSLAGHATGESFELADFRGRALLSGNELQLDAERLWFPETEMSGTGVASWDDGVRLRATLSAPVAALADLRWLVPGLPSARGGLDLDLRLGPDTTALLLSALDLRTGDGGVDGRLSLIFSSGPTLLDGELGVRALRVSALDPWLNPPVPWGGALSGGVRFTGEPGDLEVAGELETVEAEDGRPPSRFAFDGRVHLGPDPGVTAFSVASAPFHYGLLGEMDGRVAVEGAGSLRLDATGRLASGIEFSASLAHAAPGLPESAIAARGTVRRADGETIVNVLGDLRPLSFTALGAYYPRLPLTGEVGGAVSARGPLADLAVEADLETPAGPLAINARVDAHDIGGRYLIETEVRDFHLSRILPALPEETIVTGGVFVDGRGLEPHLVEADVRAQVASATVGPVTVDSARSVFRLDGGAATLDTLHAATSLGTLDASGDLGLADGLPPGEVRVAFASESLDGVRPFFMTGPIIAGDTLSRLEAEVLRLEGIDPDTLPPLADIAIGGRMAAQATLTGAVDRFTAEAAVGIEGFRYQDNAIIRAELEVQADGLPGTRGRLAATIRSDSFAVRGRDFASAVADLDLSRTEGRLRADLRRSGEESYQARASYQTDGTGGVVHLDELTARFAGGRWNLGGPARLVWSPESFVVDDFSFTRPGAGGMRIEADGLIPRRRGPAGFDLVVRSLPLERLTHVARLTPLEDANLRGTVDLGLRIFGTGDNPGMETSFDVGGPGYGGLELGRVAGDLSYRDRRIQGEIEAWSGDERVLVARGALAAALELGRVPARFPAEPMDIALVARRFPAAVVSGVIPALDEVEGRIDGEIRLTGPPADLRTDGELSLAGGALSFPALGVRYTDVEGELRLAGDARATLHASLRSGGLANVGGSVHLRPLGDPAFDLNVDGTGFRAANRYDIEGVVSGQLHLTGNYRSPMVQGVLDVEQGTLFLDEFARYQTIVDLADAAFFAAVDTTLAGVLPIVEAGRNPFLDNLVADVELRVQSDSWLRSRQMDMEIDGNLELEYDRRARRVVAAGELAAIRGSYHNFNRRFVVQQGTLEFIGIPGVNPNLDIQAVHRLRAGDNPLNVIANVGGTLLAPSVSLTSDAPAPIEEPELISYLLFARPTALLGSGEASVLSGGGFLYGEGFNLGVSELSDILQRAVVQEIGLVDYFAISNQQAAQRVGPNTSLFSSTRIELGRYLWDDVFVSVDLLPAGSATQTRTRIPNARLEWRFADLWGFEGFAEDPLLRRGVLGLQQSGPTYAHSLGFFVYREWGR